MGYEVSSEVFDGPFDLLLRLITAEEVDVYEISLTGIVAAYLEEVRRMQALDLEVATEFLLIASTLVELKCRRLLPGRDDGELDEELAIFEQRDLLLTRLVECRTFSEAAGALAQLETAAALSLARRAGPDDRVANLRPDLLAGVTPAKLAAAAIAVFAERPLPRVGVEHVLVDEVTVAEVVDELALRLPALGRVSFRELTVGAANRMRVIVHFLAVLELYKQGLVEIEQPGLFGELVVTWTAAEEAAGGLGASLVDAEYRG
jgi:segregation and condensation protein A